MVTADELRPFETAADDYSEAEALKRRLRELRSERNPFYLTADDLEPIFRWKLRGQYGRGSRLRQQNSDDAYRIATQAAFAVSEPDSDYTLELKVAFLTALRGVGVPVASAILALVEPDEYCVVDFRGWRLLFDQDRSVFDIGHYKRYLGTIKALASDLGWSPQATDLAVWELDRQRSGAA